MAEKRTIKIAGMALTLWPGGFGELENNLYELCKVCGQVDCDLYCDDPAYTLVGRDTGSMVYDDRDLARARWNGFVNGLEAVLLALGCAGVDLEKPGVEEALLTAIDAAQNNLV